MILRCGDRQRKLEGLERWPFHTFVESLPVMLQLALLLLACGLCRQMAPVNTTVAGVLIALTGLGVLFYLGIVIAGTSSYACPLQTPASTTLRGLWKEIRPRITPVVLPVIDALHRLWKVVLHQILRAMPTPRFEVLYKLWKRFQSGILHAALRLPLAITSTLRHHLCRPVLPTVQNNSPVPQEITPWMAQKDLAEFLRTNGSDVRCVSWILRNITDPEAVEAAVRLAGTIRWFGDRADIEPPYDVIVSVFEGCFDSTKEVYPGLKDRAYYSLRAILWIHALANCKSQGFSQKFHLPIVSKAALSQGDLTHLLHACAHSTGSRNGVSRLFAALYTGHHEASYIHAQGVSNLLLHLAWIKQDSMQDVYNALYQLESGNWAGVR